MSEQTIPARVDALERQLARTAAMTEQNARAIEALIHVTDRRYEVIEKRLDSIEWKLSEVVEKRFDNVEKRLDHIEWQLSEVVEKRFDHIERQLSALNESNQLLAELIRSRLPGPGENL
jgi:tetrahydromethanopterin S-methyltransferase subunit G